MAAESACARTLSTSTAVDRGKSGPPNSAGTRRPSSPDSPIRRSASVGSPPLHSRSTTPVAISAATSAATACAASTDLGVVVIGMSPAWTWIVGDWITVVVEPDVEHARGGRQSHELAGDRRFRLRRNSNDAAAMKSRRRYHSAPTPVAGPGSASRLSKRGRSFNDRGKNLLPCRPQHHLNAM